MGRSITRRSEEAAIDKAPEIEVTPRTILVTTLIHASTVVPFITSWLQGGVEWRVGVERAAVVDCVADVDVERVAVRRNTQYNLTGGYASGGPLSDRAYCTALLILGRSASVIERGVGANGRAPRAPDVVVHDGDPIELLREAGNVAELFTVGPDPREDGSGSSEDQTFPHRVCTKLPQEGEEVSRIVRVDGVAANTLCTRVLPAGILDEERYRCQTLSGRTRNQCHQGGIWWQSR